MLAAERSASAAAAARSEAIRRHFATRSESEAGGWEEEGEERGWEEVVVEVEEVEEEVEVVEEEVEEEGLAKALTAREALMWVIKEFSEARSACRSDVWLG